MAKGAGLAAYATPGGRAGHSCYTENLTDNTPNAVSVHNMRMSAMCRLWLVHTVPCCPLVLLLYDTRVEAVADSYFLQDSVRNQLNLTKPSHDRASAITASQ